jgi:heat shock protein HslJ
LRLSAFDRYTPMVPRVHVAKGRGQWLLRACFGYSVNVYSRGGREIMADVFISYSKDDPKIAGTLAGKLVPRIDAHRVALIALVILGLGASTAAAQTKESSWILEKGEAFTTIKNSPARLRLNDKQISGSTGCNVFRATLSERADKRVAIDNVALTPKLCAPPGNDNERAILQAFDKTEYIQEEADTLTFLSGAREPLLVWKKDIVGEAAAQPTQPQVNPGEILIGYTQLKLATMQPSRSHEIQRLCAPTVRCRRRCAHNPWVKRVSRLAWIWSLEQAARMMR